MEAIKDHDYWTNRPCSRKPYIFIMDSPIKYCKVPVVAIKIHSHNRTLDVKAKKVINGNSPKIGYPHLDEKKKSP